MVAAINQPTSFKEDLEARAFPYRFRRIGDPFVFLDEVGIGALVEYIVKGHLLIEAAEQLNVPFMTIRRWVEARGYFQEVEEAETESAEGVMAQARSATRNAKTTFELAKAKALMAHAEWMASKKNKKIYGESLKNQQGGGGVSYNISISTPETQAPNVVRQVIEATRTDAQDVEPVVFSLQGPVVVPPANKDQRTNIDDTQESSQEAFDFGAKPAHLEPNLKLVADRPATPTAEKPDIGPFYEEIEAI